jgi:DNA (cytosine-5)-methyltransferase 1
MQRIKILELFGGIGSPRMALENLGIPLKLIDYVEVLDFAVLAYNKMFQHEHIAQNVKEWNLHVDILIHGSPCQDFSLAGKNDLASGRSILYKRTLEIIEKELNPKPQVVIWENVPNLLSPKNLPHFQQYLDTLAKLGYKNEYRILNGKDFGIPQNRKRVFVVSIHKDSKFTFDFDNLQSKVLDKTLKNYLEPHDKVDEWYYLKEKHIAKSVERGMIRIVQNNVGTMVDGQTLWNNSHTTIPLTSYVRENIVLDSAAPVADCIIAQNPR